MGYLKYFFDALFGLGYLSLIARAILPWFTRDVKSGVWRPIYTLTEWLLAPIRAGLPPQKIGADVSPYVAIILLYLIQRFFFF